VQDSLECVEYPSYSIPEEDRAVSVEQAKDYIK
jgi:hypothetical protein